MKVDDAFAKTLAACRQRQKISKSRDANEPATTDPGSAHIFLSKINNLSKHHADTSEKEIEAVVDIFRTLGGIFPVPAASPRFPGLDKWEPEELKTLRTFVSNGVLASPLPQRQGSRADDADQPRSESSSDSMWKATPPNHSKRKLAEAD